MKIACEGQLINYIEAQVSPRADKPAEASMLVNVPQLITAYYTEAPDPAVPEKRVAFGASGYRSSAFDKALNE